MFNIKNIVNKITERGRESQPNSPGRVQDDILSKQAAEGFLCPRCMKAFPSAEDLQRHYESTHDGESDDVPEVTSPMGFLSLHHEVAERYKRQDGSCSAAENLDIQAISDPEELRRRLADALENKSSLLHEKEKLEQRAAQLARDNVALKAASDEGEGNQVALKERLKVVEAQLAHRESIDDAAVLRQELVQVQRVMDELTREKEKERDELKAELQQLKDLYSAKEAAESGGHEVQQMCRKLGELETQIEHKDKSLRDLQRNLDACRESFNDAETQRKQDSDRIESLKEELGKTCETLEQSRLMVANLGHQLNQLKEERDLLESNSNHLQMLQQELDDLKSKYESTSKQVEDKDEEIKSLQAHLDALSRQKDILKSEFRHRTKLCEELEKTNSGIEDKLKETMKDIAQKKEEISRLESERAELLVQIQAGEGANTAIQQLSQEKILLKEQAEENLKTMQELAAKGEAAEEKIQYFQAKIEELVLQLGNEENKMKSQLTVQSQLEEKLSLKEDDLNKQINENKELKLSMDKLKSNEEANKKKICQLQNDLVAKDSELEEMRSLLMSLRSDLTTARDERKREVAELKAMLQENVASMKQIENDLQNEKSSNAALREDLKNGENALSKLQDVVARKEKAIEVLDTEKAEIQKNLEELAEKEKTHIVQEWKKDVDNYKALLNESKAVIAKEAADKTELEDQMKKQTEIVSNLEKMLSESKSTAQEKEEKLKREASHNESLMKDLAAEVNRNQTLLNELNTTKKLCDVELEKKLEELKNVHASLDEVAGEKLAQLAASQSEQQALLERCYASSAESETQRKSNADLRRKLEESQAALHELGRENQTLQLELEKLVGRKWTEDSDAANCTLCRKEFSLIVRKHHCRNCGQIFCNECSSKMAPLQTNKKPVRVCDSCHNELSNK
ncbi:hypothetical protein C0J52_01269 [Blattella germanica]|nr:hypothetical protein C0J52_01269 [Blattella germanica]